MPGQVQPVVLGELDIAHRGLRDRQGPVQHRLQYGSLTAARARVQGEAGQPGRTVPRPPGEPPGRVVVGRRSAHHGVGEGVQLDVGPLRGASQQGEGLVPGRETVALEEHLLRTGHPVVAQPPVARVELLLRQEPGPPRGIDRGRVH
ncbi:hypothetical protein GCM10020295_77140 [Streptomyces cinereospinus]